ncbi:CoA transferase [Gordonia sp. HY285]|uniref:CaiB/BaiF CoA transferase family protein n=1 Tax=Gordonia liuliyuniae TaxID=2911517 RepID=UPI001F49150A|nr:CoA transferase [Gordonia liuliyuniae]MCF8609179.1 CoA transferase [Gordonia liuliyuniae]
MPGPLDGLVVVDASRGMPSGIATMMLADYGARVVKVERPGDVSGAEATLRKVLDRGKWSVAADIDTPEGLETLHEVLGSADVFVEAWGAGRAEAKGLDHASLRERYPQLVCLTVTGYGTTGPLSTRPGYEALLNARLGMSAEQRAHRPGPTFLGHPTVSYGTAFLAVIGVLSALHARKLTGRGQRVDTSLLDGMLAIRAMNWWWNEKDISYLARSGTQQGFGNKRLITDPFECADGNWLIPHTGGPGSYKRMMDLLGFGDRVRTIEGPEMSVPLDDDELVIARDLVPEAFKSRPRDEWVALFAEHDIACLPVLHPHEIFDDDQVRHAGVAVDLADADHGTVRQIGPVVRFEKTPPEVPTPAPQVGAHNGRVGELEQSPAWRPTGSRSLTRPLEGVRIADFSSFFATGFGSKLLCDLGAEVVKVEPPSGDQMRPLGDLWECSQRGKRGLCIDMRTPEGQEAVRKLIAEVDVVAVNFRPGKAEKIGLGYEQLREINPNLIYAYLPGFGSTGPKSSLKSFAPLQSGLVGMNFIGAGADNPPIRRVMGNEDLYNGFLGAVSIAMALVARQNSGSGQYLESPQLHSSLLVRTEMAADGDGNPLEPYGLDSDTTGWGPLYRLYRTSDGWVMIAVFGDQKFAAMTDALGRSEWDREFGTKQQRADGSDELAAKLEGVFASMSTETAFATLDGAGVPVEIPADDPVMPELLWDESLAETGQVVEQHHPEYGWCREVGVTIRLSDTPGAVRGPSPLLGQHTREVLTELGYPVAAIDDMVERGVCREPAAIESKV